MSDRQPQLRFRAAVLAALGLSAFSVAAAPSITLVDVTGGNFPSPIGIDYHEPTDSVVLSVNYNSGGSPYNFGLVNNLAQYSQFSPITGLTDEVKIATVRSGNVGGFVTGTLFTGNGNDGEIVKINPDGSLAANPWVSLPGLNNGLMRGSLYVDRGGAWGGDLVVATTNGELWRVNSLGVPTLVHASVGTHLEGLITLPNNPSKYGQLAGMAIAGAEQQGLMYAFDTAGNYTTFDFDINIEDIDIIDGGNFYGVAYANAKLYGAAASDFAGMQDDILLTQEMTGGGSGLYHLYLNGASLAVEPISLGGSISSVTQWEHVTFAHAGILDIPDVEVPEASTVLGGAAVVALGGAAYARRRKLQASV